MIIILKITKINRISDAPYGASAIHSALNTIGNRVIISIVFSLMWKLSPYVKKLFINIVCVIDDN